MRNILAIFKRELSGYFDAPLAYIVIPVFLSLVGGFSLFFQDILADGLASMRTVFFWSAVSLLLLIPAITMRLFAEEHRTGSIELLTTFPVTEAEMVLGKYLAALTLISLALFLTGTYPLTLAQLGALEIGPVFGGYLGLFLLAGSFAAIGTAASAMTRNQVVAFLVAMMVCLIPFVSGYALAKVPTPLLPLIQTLSFDYHFNNLERGVIDSRNVVYYGTVIALFLHISVFALVRRRLD